MEKDTENRINQLEESMLNLIHTLKVTANNLGTQVNSLIISIARITETIDRVRERVPLNHAPNKE